jgi:hypothetical protein
MLKEHMLKEQAIKTTKLNTIITKAINLIIIITKAK